MLFRSWKFEYVTCDWSNCFEKLINGEFDIMGDISYTEERAKQMLFSDEPMGEEKYYLYADLSDTDISAYNFQTLNGKRIGVLKGTQPEVMLTEWEQKYNLETTHVNIANNDDVKRKLADHEEYDKKYMKWEISTLPDRKSTRLNSSHRL